jgi:hypothetical protein
MNNRIFVPADILLPKDADMTKWTVVACDQFSSEREYWDAVEQTVADAPSSLRMMIPEVYLHDGDTQQRVDDTYTTMEKYVSQGVFETYKNSFVYVQRTQTDGKIRHGLVGALDLEAYDYDPNAEVPVRASEKTVPSRLPVRIDVRRRAILEMPHIMTLINDKQCRVIQPLADMTDSLEKLYDFDLMQGGGHIAGWRVTGELAEKLISAINDNEENVKIIIGDGNHSLAAAKEYWKEVKAGLTPEQAQTHPARFALVEVNNVYDDAIAFEAIHRVVFGVRVQDMLDKFAAAMPKGNDYKIICVTANGEKTVSVGASCIGELIGGLDSYIENYTSENGGKVDYIHGEDSVRALCAQPDAVGFILPSMGKSDFFETVIKNGLFPKKSFSIGHAKDKRYYVECRSIVL